MAATLLAAAMVLDATAYDCTFERPRSVREENGQSTLGAVGVPRGGDWQARIVVTTESNRGLQAQVSWPSNPMQLEGRYPATMTGTGTLAFAAFSRGPCLFTDTVCAALVQIVDTTNEQANIVITPAATSTNSSTGVRRAFPVLVTGTCTRRETDR